MPHISQGPVGLAVKPEAVRHRIILDTDPALQVRLGLDIDDDLAIILLLCSPEVEIVGLTTTYGNAPGHLTYRDAKSLLKTLGRSDIPVLRGAGWTSRRLDKDTEASRFIEETIRKYPGELTVVTLGPLTNLARAITSSPGLLEDARELLMMGGRLISGAAEFNFGAHPRATAAVLQARVDKFVVTLDLCFQVVFKMEHLQRLKSKPNLRIGPYLPALRRFLLWNRFLFKLVQMKFKTIPQGGFFPWDVIAVSYLINPDLFSDVSDVRMTMPGKKVMLEKVASPGRDQGPIRVPYRVDAPRFIELFISRLLSFTGPE